MRRIARGDLQSERATAGERARLSSATPPVVNAVAQDYAAWRRSVLLVAASTLLVTAIISLAGYESLADGPQARLNAVLAGNLAIVDWIQKATLIALLAGTAFVFAAAAAWRRLRTSAVLARVGWLLMFITPFVLAAIPFARLMNLDHLQPSVQASVRTTLGGLFAFASFYAIAPRALALFPGLIRSALAVKTLLPEAAAPGWVVVTVAPLYAIFLFVLVGGVIQVQGDLFLLGGVLCMAASPLVYVVRRRTLIRPQSTTDAARLVSRTKNLAGLLNLIGLALVGVFLLMSGKLSVPKLLSFLIGVAGNVFLLMTVGADFLIGVLRSAHEIGKEFHGSQLQRALEVKIGALTSRATPPGTEPVASSATPEPPS